MDDKRLKDEDKKPLSISDDYEELLKAVDAYLADENDYIEVSSGKDTEFEDVFSISTDDVYISPSKNEEPRDDGIYISKRQNKDIFRDVYSADKSVEPRKKVQDVQANQQPIRKTQTRVPPVKVDHKTNTQEIKRVPSDEEISDYEARFGRKKTQTRKKKSKAPKIFVSFVAIMLVVFMAFGGALFFAANSIMNKFKDADTIEHIENVDSLVSEGHVRNILLVGADKESGGASRSDSIMIASINKKTGKITVVSILRDTHVDVPGHQESKINAAYAWGGPNLLIQTIEQNFGIKIDDYATVDFEMFTELVDGLGGIEVEVTEDEADYINNRHSYGDEEKPETVPSGEKVHLSGYQALWYSRIRKLDSDFNRTERQRKIIGAIIGKAKDNLNPVGLFGLVSTAKDVAPYIETTLSAADFGSLMISLTSCITKSATNMDGMVVSAQLPFEGTWWYSSEWDGSSISLNLEKNREMLYELLYEEPVEETTEAEE